MEGPLSIATMARVNTHWVGTVGARPSRHQDAQRLTARFEWHYTPKHGSWLDIAEIELGVLSRHCLSQRIDNIQTLREQTTAWEKRRDKAEAKVNWQFTTADARTKLNHLYPSLNE